MIKFCNLYLPSRLLLFIVIDGTFLSLALLAALHSDMSLMHRLAGWQYLSLIAVSGIVCLGCMYLFDLYDLDLTWSGHDVLLQSLRATGCCVLLLVPLWWLLALGGTCYRSLEITLVLFIFSLCFYRLFAEWIRGWALPGERVLLVGSGPSIPLLAAALRKRRSLPLKLTGIVPENGGRGMDALRFVACGYMTEFEKVSEMSRPDRVAIGLYDHADNLVMDSLLDLRRRGVRVEDAVGLYQSLTGRVPVDLINVREMAFGKGLRLSPIAMAVNRCFGMLAAITLITLLMPVLCLIALLIKLESRGGVLYHQERVGLHGRLFQVIKFRSMYINAEANSGPIWAKKGDPRVTKVGRVLRKLRLDELPQLWNVLRGEMCLIGPRPERPHFTASLAECLPYYDVRHSIRPGITGWAQVCADYSSSVEESKIKLEYDLFYLQNQSPLLDALILIKTVKIALFGRGAR
jgi:exopolysaccharide biosynthesis polyprenyl glycosylphosphotransferase